MTPKSSINQLIASTKSSVIYEVSLGDTDWHKNRVPCILIGKKMPIKVQSKNYTTTGDAVFVRSNHLHKVVFGEQDAFVIYLEGLARDEILVNVSSPCTANSLDDSMLRTLESSLQKWDDEAEQEIIHRLVGGGQKLDAPSSLLCSFLAKIAADPMARISQTALAASLGTERTRALKLFKAETGMTLRSYQIWRSLRTAITLASSGSSLQDACFDTGFYDAPHFSRTFKSSFGVSPQSAFR